MVKSVFATLDERDRYSGGEAGDQTGKEVVVAPYYQFGQNIVLRPLRKGIANRMVSSGIWLANSDLVGYNQDKRTSLFDEIEKIGFSNYRKLDKKCDTDCSAFIAVLANIAGVKIDKNVYTDSMKNEFLKTDKFELITDTSYLISDKYLRKGDLVINEATHVILICEDGPCAYEDKGPETMYVTPEAGLYLRENPKKEAKIVAIMPKESAVSVIREVNKDWLKVQYEGKLGCCMSKFLKTK